MKEFIIQGLILFLITALTNTLGTLKTMFVSKSILKTVYLITFVDAIIFATIMKQIANNENLWFVFIFAIGKVVGVHIGDFIENNFLAFTDSETYIDKPLYGGQEYTYELWTINTYGNTAINKNNYTVSTTSPEILFRGLGPEAFDRDPSTYVRPTSKNVSFNWIGDLENKVLNLDINPTAYTVIKVLDSSGKNLIFSTSDGQALESYTLSGGHKIFKIIIPEGAVSINIMMVGDKKSIIYEIYPD